MHQIINKIKSLSFLFWVTTAIPTLIAFLYFGLLASNVYVSESRFVVRSPDKPSTSGFGVLLKNAGFSNTSDEIYAAQDYVLSRDALRAININGSYEKSYSQPHISIVDRFNTFDIWNSFEDLYKYYQKHVTINYETTSSVTTLTVRAYTAQDARKFNEQLLEVAEATVNRLNERGRQDLIRYAQAEVIEAKTKAEKAAVALSSYRNLKGVIDPEKQATVQLQMISKLQDELIATRTQLRELRAFTPANPQIEVLSSRVDGLRNEIDAELGKVAGSQKSLSSTAVEYQRLILENKFADTQLGSAMASLESAKNEARRKQAYVERIVQPNLPDEALEPRRAKGILATFVLGLVAWGVLSMLLAGMKEHQD